MFSFERVKNYFNQPLRQTLARFAAFLPFEAADADQLSKRDRSLIALLKWALTVNDKISERSVTAFNEFIADQHPEADAGKLADHLRLCEPMAPPEAAMYLLPLGEVQRRQTVSGLVRLSLAAGSYDEEHRSQIAELAEALEIPDGMFNGMEQREVAESERRLKLVRSGTGLAVALIVLLVFILTATLLRSVIFGLILAYLCLPIEKMVERKLLKQHPFKAGEGKRGGKITSMVVGRIKRFVGNDSGEPADLSTPEMLHRNMLVGRACTISVAGMMLILLLAGTLAVGGGVSYVNSLRSTVRNWAEDRKQSELTQDGKVMADDINGSLMPGEVIPPPERTAEENFISDLRRDLDDVKAKFQNIPLVAWGVDEISKTLNDPEAQQKFFSTLLQKSGGILQFSLGMLSWFSGILLDVLLTVFFFSLFLKTVALNTDEHGKGLSFGNYLVRTIFNGRWLPEASEDTLLEGERIIGGVVYKLKAWLRGYLILISIDFIVYSSFFVLLDVPYALILGFIAGCGLLLPYIGPIVSALLTVLVTLALGGDSVSGLQIAGILTVYLIENGIVEQFFLYPAVIGEALGLTTLETIIVVLLGGYFAGITGMIFALPAAAIIKYLVPQAYRTIRR